MGGHWIDAFPALARLETPARRILERAATVATLPAGTVPFRHGDSCDSFLFVLSGTVRVHMTSETGREIVLYRVEEGQTCILTTCCLMANEDYPAEAVAETDLGAVVLPAAGFRELVARSAVFRDFIFSTYGRRVFDLTLLVEEVAFQSIDVRLARFLLETMDAGGRLTLTHQEVAVELGSVREVISRQLKEFERRSWVALRRGRIDVLDAVALRRLSDGGAV